ncbi:MAG: CoA-binding protein [Armatimonadota bacterium]
MSENVAIIGASDDPDRYAYKAFKLLQAHGHNPIPVNPTKDSIEGIKCYPSIKDISDPIDTVTLYVRPSVSSEMTDDIIAAEPRRVIMNPGTENDDLAKACEDIGIQVVFACTLVLLGTDQF